MPPMAFKGVVTKVGVMQKTATVLVSRTTVHKKTRKEVERSKKYLTHDPEESLQIGDEVIIRNCPPVSARKRFKLEKIIYSPETEWKLKHANQETETPQNSGPKASLGGGERQGPLNVTAGDSMILNALKEARSTSPSKLSQGGMAGTLGGKSIGAAPSAP